MSGGRAAWNLVTTDNPTEAWNFNRKTHPSAADRYAVAEEYADVVRKLWDSWENGAFARDKVNARYFDPARLHIPLHKGPHLPVRGPLDVQRSPQGQPVIVQAGSSPAGMALGARVADVIFTSQQSLTAAQEFYRRVKGQVASFGRDASVPSTLPLGQTASSRVLVVLGRAHSDGLTLRQLALHFTEKACGRNPGRVLQAGTDRSAGPSIHPYRLPGQLDQLHAEQQQSPMGRSAHLGNQL